MISISHWGMFECHPRVFVIPEGFKFDERYLAEWLKPGGIIRLVRDK